ncbi:MAG: rhodanese-like domain-containing protein [Campylobacterota bacterium]|nr:rhodanese-like domain-containing protein [Campylobacterota bacterium]
MKKHIVIYLISSLLLVINVHAAKKMTDGARHIMEEAQKQVPSITPQKFKKLIDDDEVEFIQLDVRENDQHGHGEIWTMEKVRLTRGYIEYKVEEAIPNKKSKIIVVCCSGKRAVLAAQTMKRLGFKDISYLEGGVNGWLSKGYPLDTVFGELYLKQEVDNLPTKQEKRFD